MTFLACCNYQITFCIIFKRSTCPTFLKVGKTINRNHIFSFLYVIHIDFIFQ